MSVKPGKKKKAPPPVGGKKKEEKWVEPESYSERMCSHGMCLSHDPDWETIEKDLYEPNPWDILLFFKKTYWRKRYRCCEKQMHRYKEGHKAICKKCGRKKVFWTWSRVAYCHCCGYHCQVDKPRNQGY